MKSFAPFTLDPINECVWRGRERLHLTPTAFAVLRSLVERAGTLVRQEQLLQDIWPNTFVQPEVLKKYVMEIRRVLGDSARTPTYIETAQRRGYRFIAKVTDDQQSSVTTPPPSPLFGRDRELERLRGALQRIRAGDRQVLVLTGEPGIGKSALAEAVQSEAAAQGMTVACGHCLDSYAQSEPFYPWLEAFTGVSRGPMGQPLVNALRACAPSWLVQFPALTSKDERESLRRELIAGGRDRMVREGCEALEALSERAPLVIVIEDLHWADGATLDVISALPRRRGRAALALVLTYRQTDASDSDDPARRLLHDLFVHGLCDEIPLPPLERSSVSAYVSSALHQAPLPDGLAALVHDRSDGNPLFMIAVLDHLVARRVLESRQHLWQLTTPLATVELGVPDTLRHLVEILVARLTPQAQRALEAGSLAGVTFPSWIVAALLDLSTDEAEQECEWLVKHTSLLRRTAPSETPEGIFSRYAFVHAVYRDVLYERQSLRRRLLGHRAVAERLEAIYGDQADVYAAELAWHWEIGHDFARAVRYVRVAAEHAVGRYAHREAMSMLWRALDLTRKVPEPEQQTPEILERIGILALLQGEAIASADAFEQLERVGRERLSVDLQLRALRYAMHPLAWFDKSRCLAAAERASALAGQVDDPVARAKADIDCGFIRVWWNGWDATSAEVCRQALDTIRAFGDERAFAGHLTDYSYVQWAGSDYREGLANAERSLPRLIDAGDLVRYLDAQLFRCWHLMFLGEWGQALAAIDEAAGDAAKNGHVRRAHTLRLTRAWLSWHAQAPKPALIACQAALDDLSNLSAAAGVRVAHLLSGASHVLAQNYRAAADHLTQAQDLMDNAPVCWDWFWRLQLDWSWTELHLALGDLGEARRAADKLLESSLKSGEKTWKALAWNNAAAVSLADGSTARAEQEVRSALSIVDEREVPLARWRVLGTAADVYAAGGNTGRTAELRAAYQQAVNQLAQTMLKREPLRSAFLSSPTVTTHVLRDESSRQAT